MTLLLVLLVALVAGIISGIIGMGGSIIMLPILVPVYGPKAAVPIMAVAAVLSNLSRVAAWWREIDWRAFAAYAVTGVPAAVLGANTLLALPARTVDLAIATFLLAMIPGRRWLAERLGGLNLQQMAIAGGLIGFLTGVVASTGPVSVPVFLGYGLAKGAFIGTEAASSLAIYIAKAITFRSLGGLDADILLNGVIVGAALMAGAFIARPFVLRMEPERFRLMMDAMLLISGGSLLVAALMG
jgi:uncharacterized membrane protein YfcA